jgi:cyanate permease
VTDPTIVPKQTFASPMSFVGSARRFTASGRSKTGAMKIAWWTLGLVGLVLFWCFLLCWYFFAFVVFGIITVPIRLMRRGQRKSQAVQEAQLAAMRQALDQSRPKPPE